MGNKTTCQRECENDDAIPTCLETNRSFGVACTRQLYHKGNHSACGQSKCDLVVWKGKPVNADREFVCGTKEVVTDEVGDHRVVCAMCGQGGSVLYGSREMALNAAIRGSGRPCGLCGAS